MLAKELGENWKDSFNSFEEAPFAAASIGKIHHKGYASAVRII
jgi:aarF domain-containing kinase